MKSLKVSENSSPVSRGGGLRGMRKSTFIGCRSECGGSPFASSIAVMPSDQMSACERKQHTGYTNHMICNLCTVHGKLT